MENINEVMGILAKYGITPEYVVVTGNSTFEEQVPSVKDSVALLMDSSVVFPVILLTDMALPTSVSY